MRDTSRFSTETWSSLLDQSGEILLVIDIETARIADGNEMACEFLGYEKSGLLDRSVTEITGFESEARWRDHLPSRAEERHLGENELYPAEGDPIPVEASVSRVQANGEEYVLVVARDISERKAREAELERQKHRAEEYFETAGNVMLVLDRDRTVERINERGSDLLGYERSELLGADWFETVVPGEIEPEIEDIFEAFWTAESPPIETHTHYIETKTGEKRFVKWHNTALHDTSGAVTGVLSSGIDITERKAYEEELDESNTLLRTIVENMPMGVLVEDADRDILLANEELPRVLGASIPADELIGRDCATAAQNLKGRFADPASFVDGIERRIDRREPVHNEEIELVSGRILERDYIPFSLLGGPANLWIYRDVTERKEGNREIASIRDFLDDIFEALPYPLYVLDTENYEIERTNEMVPNLAGKTCYELSHQRDKPCHEGDESFPCPLKTVLETGEPTTVEHTHYGDDGEEYVHEVHAAPIFDEDGNVVQMVESLIDITSRTEYERQLEEQRDNLEVLNQVLRHDIRNDLQLVTAYADILEERVDDQQEYVQTIRENARHAVELTTTARDMADVWLSDREERTRVSLQSTLENELDEARSVHDDAVITVAGTVPETPVLADEMLGSVFHNILQNAVRHNDKDIPEVTVATAEREDTVRVRIADNGPGVPAAQKEAIFGRGEKGLDSSGTGLGLYLVKTLVEGYGGDVWVEDNDPEGAVFVVELPTERTDD
ncbi:MAG: PAS domain S-box protein [Halobacteriota archaeon]